MSRPHLSLLSFFFVCATAYAVPLQYFSVSCATITADATVFQSNVVETSTQSLRRSADRSLCILKTPGNPDHATLQALTPMTQVEVLTLLQTAPWLIPWGPAP